MTNRIEASQQVKTFLKDNALWLNHTEPPTILHIVDRILELPEGELLNTEETQTVLKMVYDHANNPQLSIVQNDDNSMTINGFIKDVIIYPPTHKGNEIVIIGDEEQRTKLRLFTKFNLNGKTYIIGYLTEYNDRIMYYEQDTVEGEVFKLNTVKEVNEKDKLIKVYQILQGILKEDGYYDRIGANTPSI